MLRTPLTLAWWILLLGALEAASLVLDRSQHLPWGRVGFLLLKVSYLVFACILLFRFLSFRARKPYETMVDSYNRIAGQSWSASGKEVVKEWRKFLFHMALVVIASANVLAPMAWGDITFKSSILLDLCFWLMALRWLVRAYWLKSLGRRERLKEELDDARSRRKPQAAAIASESPAAPGSGPAGMSHPGSVASGSAQRAWPFLALFVLSALATTAVGVQRWRTADWNFIVSDLKGCLQVCLDRALERFHQDGRLAQSLQTEGCLLRHREDVDIGMGFQRGELMLWAVEKPGRDYFGNGKAGDQGLMLDAEGRFRDTGRRR